MVRRARKLRYRPAPAAMVPKRVLRTAEAVGILDWSRSSGTSTWRYSIDRDVKL